MDLSPPALDILIVAPHPDDAELGMGGAICKFIEDGKKVGILELTDGEPTPHGSVDIRRRETSLATDVLKIDWRGCLGLENRALQPTLEARKQLASVFRLCGAPWIFAPYWNDAHPDHVAATQLIEDARFWAKLSKTDMPGRRYHPRRIYNYFSVHLKQVVQPAFILDISTHFEKKLEAIRCFESQFITGRSQTAPTFVDSVITTSEYWGQLIGVRYGEPFQCKEPIGLATMDSLI